MTPHDLLAAFEILAEAPDGIARLRELVLQLAVRGKLVPQDPEDEPASVLLECIAAEKARLVKEGKIAKPKALPPVREDEVPFAVPEGWVWTCTAALGIVNPRNDADETSIAGFAPMPLIPTDYREQIHAEPRAWGAIRKGYTHFAEGDIAVAKITPCFQNRKSCVMEGLPGGIGAGTTELHVLRPILGIVHPKYLLLVYKTPEFIEEGITTMTGTAGQQRVPYDYFAFRPIPLSPLAEQHRIVAKVDTLMALLDRLEAARNKREATRVALRNATLAALRDAPDAEAVEAAWLCVAERMDDLFTDPADVAPLRQTILQLAVRGKLVPQDPEDEPASVLLGKRVVTLANGGPWHLPHGWEWSAMRHLGDILGGSTPSKSNAGYWTGNIPWISPKDMKCDRIVDVADYITESAVKDSAVRLIPAGALLMVVRGMILAHSFPTALAEVPVTINQDMKALIPCCSALASYLLLASKGLRDIVLKLVERSTHGTCKLPSDSIFDVPIPIPPLAEQHRIVAKVDALMALCDALEARLAAAREAQAAFAAAAVESGRWW
jgi:type I restriction enzyme S subunit